MEMNNVSGLSAVHEACMQPPPGVRWTPDWLAGAAKAPPAASVPPTSPVVVAPAAQPRAVPSTTAAPAKTNEVLALPAAPPVAAPVDPAVTARAAWNASPALQAEFCSADAYANWRHGVATGRCRVYAPGAAASLQDTRPNLALTAEQARVAWKASPKLQAEHASAEAYANWRQGVALGRVRIYGQKLG